MAKKKRNTPPIGFGRQSPPDDAFNEAPDPPAAPEEKPLMPPLAAPLAINETQMYELFTRYGLRPLLPVSTFEYQLVEIIAGLEKRLLEVDSIEF